MKLSDTTYTQLDEFCSIITHGNHKSVLQAITKTLDSSEDGEDATMDTVLWALSGDLFEDDSNPADMPPQYYLVTSDNGAPCKEDFLFFMDNLMRVHNVHFNFDSDAIDDDRALYSWLAKTGVMAEQSLSTHYLINFYTGSEDYHFTFVRKEDYEKLTELYTQLSEAFDEEDENSIVIIKEDFEDANLDDDDASS